ncbi:MAG: BTAD domain-containing putative transcriptional regulator [Bacillota bacterium]|nr:BTAD domain-containing putative transcriptional regulator [Bacillota bacterium]
MKNYFTGSFPNDEFLKECCFCDLGHSPLMKKNNLKSVKKKHLYVFCFGCFEVFTDYERKSPVHWRTSKAKELFAYFIHNSGKLLPINKILADIWPDAPPNKASDLFHTNLCYVRYMLKSYGGDGNIYYNNGAYSIHIEDIFCDYILFELFLKQSVFKTTESNIKLLIYSASLYLGEYLDNTNFEWASDKKEYYFNLYIKILNAISLYYMDHHKYEDALYYLKKLVSNNPFLEDIHVMIMQALSYLGDRQALIKQYNKLCEILIDELGVSPKEKTMKIFYELLNSSND